MQSGPDHAVSLEPNDLSELIKGCAAVNLALGNEKKLHEEEKPIIAWARESVVTLKDLKSGDILTTDNTWVKRPSPIDGEIPASEYETILGKEVTLALKKDVKLKWQDIKL